jgi:tartrate dehydratase alpha subunit/fumarate hydratase class I-like protein
MVYDPVFERKNLRDNILPIIHSPKGAGSENTSSLAM